ncbi:MAG: zinc-dependent metalloprotease [Nitriliruptoraceae bacterium]
MALRTARVVAPFPRHDPARAAALTRAVHAELPTIDAAARAFTGLGSQLPPTSIRVVGRSAWVRTNLEVIAATFEPLRDRLEQRPAISRRVLGLQLGALLGLLSTKVLGQFVLPLAGPGSGQLLLVGPNVLALAQEHGELADDIRRTVVLHEVTHRLQFDGTGGWLGDHLRDLVASYLAHTDIDANRLADLAPKLPAAIARAKETGELKPLLETVLTPEQAEVMDQAQGLMSLLEGHGNTTMYSAERAGITDPEAVRTALANRTGDLASRILTAVAGLEMKRRQYREGEVFVRAVLDRAGTDGLNQAFAAAENLPRADEIGDPDAWLDRVGDPAQP